MLLADQLGALSMRALWRFSASLEPATASAIGAAVLRRAGPRIKKHRLLLDNLRIVFPDWPETRIQAMARESWAELGRVIAEFPHFERFLEPAETPFVEVVDATGVLKRAADGEPAILAGAHLANWELLAAAAVRAGVPLTVVHAARANPGIEALVERHRRALGCGFLEQDESVLAMLRQIRQGRSIGVLVDQRYAKGSDVPFFGRPAKTALGPALLAARFGLPFVPVRAERVEPCRFRITFEPPMLADPAIADPRAAATELMTRLHGRFEVWIRERPDQWLCIKRRWPKVAPVQQVEGPEVLAKPPVACHMPETTPEQQPS